LGSRVNVKSRRQKKKKKTPRPRGKSSGETKKGTELPRSSLIKNQNQAKKIQKQLHKNPSLGKTGTKKKTLRATGGGIASKKRRGKKKKSELGYPLEMGASK